MQTKMNSKAGFTLVEIMIVVAIIGLLAAIAIPNFVKARTTAQQNTCIANMKQIEGAIEQWALETKQTGTPADGDIFGAAAYIKVAPKCPTENSLYVLPAVGTTVTCPDNVLNHALPN